MLRIASSFFVLALFYLAGCRTNETGKMNLAKKPLAFPTVLDTIGLEVFKNIYGEKNLKWFSTGEYRFNYIGKYKDTIYSSLIVFNYAPLELFLDDYEAQKEDVIKPKNPFQKYQKYHIPWGKESPYNFSDSFNIELQVNTSKKIANSYPVMLTNKASDTIAIGYGEVIPIIMEAKNKNGNWRPIQQTFSYMCGNGIGTIILPPNEIVITLAPIFKGKYKTKLRLKYGKSYSKPFDGNIHYSQFEYRK